MDGVYEGDENQEPIKSMGLEPVVSKEMHKNLNKVERLFWRLKGNRLSVLQIR